MSERDPIDSPRLGQLCDEFGLDWIYHLETASTNIDVRQHFERFSRQSIAFAEMQNAGRGRRGRKWISPPSRNIYCSLGLSRRLAPHLLGLLSILAGVALCRGLHSLGYGEVRLKWPNDIVVDGSKLGGVLIETRSIKPGQFFFAVGVGLNVNMATDELIKIPQAATSLMKISGKPVSRTGVLITLLRVLAPSMETFQAQEIDRLIASFDHYDAYRGQTIELIDAETRIVGVDRGITSEGLLRLETDCGIELFSAAEISLRAIAAGSTGDQPCS